jgi:hypothetical protein
MKNANASREWFVGIQSLFLMTLGTTLLLRGDLGSGAAVVFLFMAHLWYTFFALTCREIAQARRDQDRRLRRFIQLFPQLTPSEKTEMLEQLFR